jgi:hypothetical protein
VRVDVSVSDITKYQPQAQPPPHHQPHHLEVTSQAFHQSSHLTLRVQVQESVLEYISKNHHGFHQEPHQVVFKFVNESNQ